MPRRTFDHRSVLHSKLVAAVVLVGASLLSSSAHSSPTGVVNLAPGESRQVWLGPTYWWLRVSNNISSKGTVTVTIDNRDSRVLSAGLCTEDSGGAIDLHRDREGQAVINYRSMPASSNS
jgi:hypothetical protein